MEKQIIPTYQVERVHQVMNYLACFSPALEMNDYLTAEEFFVALESMNQDSKFDELINYVAASFVMTIFRDIKEKNKHQDYLSYEYDFDILKRMRTCFKRIDDNVDTFISMWRQFLTFFMLIKPFRKQYMVPNYSASNVDRREEDEDNEDDDQDDDDEDQQEQDENNNRRKSKMNKNDDNEEAGDNDESSESSGQKQYKKREESNEDKLYEHYKCRAITDVDQEFADFSTNEKLEAFHILVKLGYKLPFCQTFSNNRFKTQVKDEEIRSLKSGIIEKETEKDEVQKQIEELEKVLLQFTSDDLNSLPSDQMQIYKKEKVKMNPLRQKLDRVEKSISKQSAELIIKKKTKFFQNSNWVMLGKDKNKQSFYVCSYEPSCIFKKLFKLTQLDEQMECIMHQYDNLSSIRAEFNLNNIADDQLWSKINSLNRDGVLSVPEVRETLEVEVDEKKDDENSNFSRKQMVSNYYQAKTKLIKENILSRQFSFVQQPQSLAQSSHKKPPSKNLEDLSSFAFNKRVTRSLTSGAKNKRKKIIIEDDTEDSFDDGADDDESDSEENSEVSEDKF